MFQKTTLFLIILSYALKSQNFNLIVGKTFDCSDKRSNFHYIGSDNSGFFVYRSDFNQLEEQFTLTKLTHDSSAFIFEKKINLNKNERPEQSFVKNNKIFLFSRILEQEAGKISYLLRIFNAQNGEMQGDAQVVDETTVEYTSRKIEIVFSPDSKKMMTYLLIGTSKGLQKIEMKAYETSTFKKLWKKEILSSYESSTIASGNYLIDNEGRLIYLIYYSRPDLKRDLHCVCISPPGSAINTFIKIPSEEITTLNVNLELVKNELVCSGEFLKGADADKYSGKLSSTGFFTIFLDKEESKIKTKNYNYLSSELQQKLTYKTNNPVYKSKGVKKDNKLFRHFGSYFLDGNFYVIRYHGYEYTMTSNAGSRYFNYVREIIVLKYNSDQKLDWMKIIPRYMVEAGNVNADILLASAGKELCLLYYDTPRNIEKYPDVNNYEAGDYKIMTFAGSKVIPVSVSVSKNGSLKRTVLDSQEKPLKFWDAEETVINSSTILLEPEYSSKKGRIDLLHLDN